MAAPDGAPVEYRAPVEQGRAEIRDRGSRFLAVVMPVDGEEEARERLRELETEMPDATHHCWAARLGAPPPLERSSDAGEPSGTAGAPILQVLRGAEISDVLAVVVRWYGGVKLGKGGLARAYAAAAREALVGLPVTLRFPTVDLVVELPYDRLGPVKRLVHPPRVELVEERYGADVRLVLRVHAGEVPAVRGALADLGLGAASAAPDEPAAESSSG